MRDTYYTILAFALCLVLLSALVWRGRKQPLEFGWTFDGVHHSLKLGDK
jgi:hypothetical protein